MRTLQIIIDPKRSIGTANPMIYGQFLEHFHRQVYGGIYDPDSPFADENGLRQDVINALKKIHVPVVRWPGGCFVSAYHWLGGVGKERTPYFDKAWCVEEPNTFGTDEYIRFCRQIGAQPYICTNAGTGTCEEMSDWLEYCNQTEGKFARMRTENGHTEPYHVKYWSIGNENWGSWEIGSKSAKEWSRFVTEAAKMMRRVDPSIQLFAASVAGLEWNMELLKEAGHLLNWVSIHGYWDMMCEKNEPADYEQCMLYSTQVEEPIQKIKHILGALGMENQVRVAYDEWNLRSWHHPGIMDFSMLDPDHEHAAKMRDGNDINSIYTMADAVFAATFLSACLRNCDTVEMANFSPIVNTRGAVFTYDKGIVLRPTYHVFDLYTNHMGNQMVDSYIRGDNTFCCKGTDIPMIDAAAALTEDEHLTLALVNRNPDEAVQFQLILREMHASDAVLYTVNGETKDSYNDIARPDAITIKNHAVTDTNALILDPHSVNILTCKI